MELLAFSVVLVTLSIKLYLSCSCLEQFSSTFPKLGKKFRIVKEIFKFCSFSLEQASGHSGCYISCRQIFIGSEIWYFSLSNHKIFLRCRNIDVCNKLSTILPFLINKCLFNWAVCSVIAIITFITFKNLWCWSEERVALRARSEFCFWHNYCYIKENQNYIRTKGG